MRVFRSATLSAILLTATLFYGPCLAFDDETSKPSTAIKRLESLTKQLLNAGMEIPRQVLPIVKETENELARELRSDWPKIRKELFGQMHHLLPKKDRSRRQ
jgi:hypothetical protein